MEAKKTEGRASALPAENSSVNADLRKKTRTERSQIISEHNEELSRLKEKQAAAINHLRKTNAEKEKAENYRLQKALEDKNAQAQKEYQKAAESQTRAIAQTRQMSDQEREKLQQNKTQFADERDLRREAYRQEQDSLDKIHKEEVLKKKAAVDDVRHQQRTAAEAEKLQFEEQRLKQREHYRSEMEKEKNFYVDQIEGRKGHFEKAFNENELKYQLAIEDQKIKYQGEIEKNHDTFIDKMQKFDHRGDDPFYKVQDLGAELMETADGYQISIFVPESELKNFKVKVLDDKIMVTGARKFEDEIHDQRQKVATNNYQTIHQEFKLGSPADKDLFKREYRDGVLIVSVPKRGFGVI